MGDQGPNTLLAILGDLPLVVRHEITQLPEAQQQLSIGEYSKKRRKLILAYLFWVIFSHYAYLNNWKLTLLMLGTLGGLAVWWLIDIFRVPRMVRNYNRDTAVAVLRPIRFARE